jgi:hypothetical protein
VKLFGNKDKKLIEVDPRFVDTQFKEEIEEKLLDLVKEKPGAMGYYFSEKNQKEIENISREINKSIKPNQSNQLASMRPEKASEISKLKQNDQSNAELIDSESQEDMDVAKYKKSEKSTIDLVNNFQNPKGKN